jgi:hypothetical protein
MNQCFARKSKKGEGRNLQCPNKKKPFSDYCGKHINCDDPFVVISKEVKQVHEEKIKSIDSLDEEESLMREKKIEKQYQNSTEFFTLEDITTIPKEYFYEYEENGKLFAFDIRTLNDYIISSNLLEEFRNPYTNIVIPKSKLMEITKYYSKISKKREIVDYKDTIEFTPEKKLEWRVLEVFQKINNLGHYSDYQWFWDLSLSQLKRFYKELEDLWNYRLMLSHAQKQKILPHYTPFIIYTLAIFDKVNVLNDARKILIDEIDKFISMGKIEGKNGNDNKYTGSIIVLTALVEVSAKAAMGLPHLIPIVD